MARKLRLGLAEITVREITRVGESDHNLRPLIYVIPNLIRRSLFLCYGSLLQLFEGTAQLVWTGGALDATTDAVETGNHIVDLLTSHQLTDALQVSVASS